MIIDKFKVAAGASPRPTILNERFYLSCRQAMPGVVNASIQTFVLMRAPKLTLYAAFPLPHKSHSLLWGPRNCSVFTCLADKQCRAILSPRGIPGKRRRRWKCG